MQVDLKEIHYLKSTKAKRKLGVKMSDRNDFRKSRRLSPELADIVGKTEVLNFHVQVFHFSEKSVLLKELGLLDSAIEKTQDISGGFSIMQRRLSIFKEFISKEVLN